MNTSTYFFWKKMHSLTSNTYFFQTADTVTTMTLKDARNGNEFLISSSKEFSMLLNVIGWFFHLKEKKENNVKLVRLPTKKHIGNSSGNSVAFCSNTEQKSCEQNINNLFRQLCPEQINRNCGLESLSKRIWLWLYNWKYYVVFEKNFLQSGRPRILGF